MQAPEVCRHEKPHMSKRECGVNTTLKFSPTISF